MKWAIHWGHQQGTLGLDARADVPAVQLVGYKTSQGETLGLCNEVFQLKRLSSPPPCGPEQAWQLAWDILSSMEEHLQQRGGAAMPKGGHEWGSTRALMPHYWDETPQRILQDDNSYNCDLADAREAHWQVLEAAHLIEERIERLSQLAMRMRPDDCQHSHSWGHSRRWSRGHWWRHTKTPAGGDCPRDLRGRQTQSPSPNPTRPQKHVTFQDSESSPEEGPLMRWHTGQSSERRKAEEGNLGPHLPWSQN